MTPATDEAEAHAHDASLLSYVRRLYGATVIARHLSGQQRVPFLARERIALDTYKG